MQLSPLPAVVPKQMRRLTITVLAAALLAASAVPATPARIVHAAPPALPADRLHFGITSHGGAELDWFKATGVPWRYRYLYLAGGVNTANPWPTWQDPAKPPGQYAVDFMVDSASVGAIPVFTWYQLLQSNPQLNLNESDRDWAHLTNSDTMNAYYASFQLLMQRAGASGHPVVVHVEPDLWGYLQQRSQQDATVLSTAQSFSQQLVALRDTYAPNVVLAAHASMWSSGFDVASNTDPNLNVAAQAHSTATFLAAAGSWDAIFNDVDDHDAGWWEATHQTSQFFTHWWDPANQRFPNFSRYLSWVHELKTTTGLPQLAWQVPVGNQYFLTMNNTCGHYQDNVAAYFIGHPQDLFAAGLIGVMFGAGNGCQTTQYDSRGDGITNNGGQPTTDPEGGCTACNVHTSQFADDDGGYLRQFVGQYYAPALPGPGTYHPVVPYRLLDTRLGAGRLGPGGTLNVQVAGVDGLPGSGVGAAAINVTVTDGSQPSFVTIFPAGQPLPWVSNLNFRSGQQLANLSQVAVGSGGQVTVYNSAGLVHLILDLVGWYSSTGASGHAGLYRPVTPVRVLDTRVGLGGPSTPFGPDTERDLDLGPDLPDARTSAVILNLTAVSGSQASYLEAFPAGAPRPTASNLNFPPGRNLANRVMVQLGSGGSAGKVGLYNSAGRVDVVADLVGWFTNGADATATGGLFHPLVPVRILDTRPGTQVGPYGTPLGPSGDATVAVAGAGGVPGGTAATAVSANLGVTDTTAASFLTVYPSGQGRPLASDLNWQPGETLAELTIGRLGTGGAVVAHNDLGSTDLFVDLSGYYD